MKNDIGCTIASLPIGKEIGDLIPSLFRMFFIGYNERQTKLFEGEIIMSKEKEVLETMETTEGFEAVTEVVEEKGFAEKAKAFTKAHWKKAAIGVAVVGGIVVLKKLGASYDVVESQPVEEFVEELIETVGETAEELGE